MEEGGWLPFPDKTQAVCMVTSSKAPDQPKTSYAPGVRGAATELIGPRLGNRPSAMPDLSTSQMRNL